MAITLSIKFYMARPEGLEPPTTRFEAWYSIQLSYGRGLINQNSSRCDAVMQEI